MQQNLKLVIGALVVVLVGLVLSPTITTYAQVAAGNATAAGQTAAATFYNLVPFGWAIAIFGFAVALIYVGLKH